MANLLNEIESINSECFIYENYESNWWHLLEISFFESLEASVIRRCVSEFAVGYCEGGKLSVRPNADMFAVMFEKDGQRFWFHLEKWWFEDVG